MEETYFYLGITSHLSLLDPSTKTRSHIYLLRWTSYIHLVLDYWVTMKFNTLTTHHWLTSGCGLLHRNCSFYIIVLKRQRQMCKLLLRRKNSFSEWTRVVLDSESFTGSLRWGLSKLWTNWQMAQARTGWAASWPCSSVICCGKDTDVSLTEHFSLTGRSMHR